MKRKLAMLLACMTVVGSLAACGSQTDTAVEETTATEEVAEETEEVEEEAEEEVDTTGLLEVPDGYARSYTSGEVVTEEEANKRPIAFMIENSADCIPNYGIGDADIVYEFEAEGGIPREMAIFTDEGMGDLTKIGNSRSCREYFAYTAIAWDAIYVHCGSAYEAKTGILDTGIIDNIWLENNDGGLASYRDASRNSGVHSVYATADGVRAAIEKLGYSMEHSDDFYGFFAFNDMEEEITYPDGQDAAVVDLGQKGSKPWIVYDEDEGVYYKYQYGAAHTDANTGETITFENIIVQECSTEYYYDIQNHDRTRIGFTGTGEGWYITNGKAVPITWECDAAGQATRYYTEDGEFLYLNRGKTLVEVIDEDNTDAFQIYATEAESPH